MATLREHWNTNGGQAVFDNEAGTVTVFQNGVEIATMPQRFFPLKETDFDREVVFVNTSYDDDTSTQTYAKLV